MSAETTVAELLAFFDSAPPIGVAVFMAFVALLPVLMLCCSCFLRVTIVLGILRSGFGAQQVIPGAAVGLFSLILTVLVMAPVGEAVLKNTRTAPPLTIPAEQGALRFSHMEETLRWGDAALAPLREFLDVNTSDRERDAITDLLRVERLANARERSVGDWRLLIAAFLLSELRRGFVQGLILLLPLLLVDLSIAIAVTALGMSMLNPQSIALPAKIALFTLSDGWIRLFQNLFHAYRGAA